jgi:hypothetical protein
LSSKALYTLSAAVPARAFSFRCAALSDASVHIALVWTDPPGNPAALKQLVHDLDLVVYVGGGDKVFGNTLAYADTANTVEKAVVTCRSPDTVTAVVTAAQALLTPVQTFALVANGNVITELAPELSPVPAFPPGRPTPLPTTSKPCGNPDDLVNEYPAIHIAAPMKFKDPSFKLPATDVALTNAAARFTASLAMFIGAPEYSVLFVNFLSGPWVGFSCGSYVCSLSGSAAPCYLVMIVNDKCNCHVMVLKWQWQARAFKHVLLLFRANLTERITRVTHAAGGLVHDGSCEIAMCARCTRARSCICARHFHSTSIANFCRLQNLFASPPAHHPPTTPASCLSPSRHACCLALQPPTVYHRLAQLRQCHHIPRFSMGGKRGVSPPRCLPRAAAELARRTRSLQRACRASASQRCLQSCWLRHSDAYDAKAGRHHIALY